MLAEFGLGRYRHPVARKRVCTKPSCQKPAVATLTYVYSDCTAVLGPLATYAEPHCYDLCEEHSQRLTAPVGWEIVRLEPDPDALKPSQDDIEALANAVREAGRPREDAAAAQAQPADEHPSAVEVSRKGHLRVLRNVD